MYCEFFEASLVLYSLLALKIPQYQYQKFLLQAKSLSQQKWYNH